MIDPIREAANIQEFKARRVRQLIATGVFVLFFFPLMMLTEQSESGYGLDAPVLIAILVATALGIVIFSLVNWRCPSCNGYLGKTWRLRFCPKCGAKLSG